MGEYLLWEVQELAGLIFAYPTNSKCTDLLTKIEILQFQMYPYPKYVLFSQDSALILHFLLHFRSPHYACPEVIRVSVLSLHSDFLPVM